MKRLLLLGFISVALFCQASDIIITTSNEQIKCTIDGKDAAVIKFTTTDGGKYTLPISEVATLLYEDGRVEQMIYSQGSQPSATVSEDGYVQPITQSEAIVQPINPYALQTEEKPRWRDEELSSMPKHEIVKVGKTYYMDDKIMSSQLYLRFIQKNCPKAYKQAKSWGVYYGTGYATLCAGVGLFGAGIGIWAAANETVTKYINSKSHSSYETQSYYKALGEVTTGKILFAVGVPVLAAGITLLSYGIPWSNKSHETYNKSLEESRPMAHNRSNMRLSLQTHGNDIGLALQF